MATSVLEVTGLGRAFANADVSGDAWLHLTQPWGDRIALVDGAGHGPTAAIAANAALDSVTASATLGLDETFGRCHRALLSSTRGAVLTIVDITKASVTFGGVGNVDGHLVMQHRSHRFTADRGLLGSTLPRIHPVTFELIEPDWFIVMHSDGISSRMKPEWKPLANLEAREAYLDAAMAEWGRSTDDATLVMITPALGASTAK